MDGSPEPSRGLFTPLAGNAAMMLGRIIVWLVIGSLAGTLAGRLVTFRKDGLGKWANVGIGMLGAVVGGFLFGLLGIDLGLGEIKVTLEDLIAAVAGSLLCIFAWWLIRKWGAKKAPPPAAAS